MKKLVVLLLAAFLCAPSYGQQTQKENDTAYLEELLSGSVVLTDKNVSIQNQEWNPHTSFKGVYLKHLIIGENTENKISCHIVKIEPNCQLDTHKHPEQIEIHQVLKGKGTFYIGDKEIEYTTGTMSVIPANTPHKVLAGKEGLYILATFNPTLL